MTSSATETKPCQHDWQRAPDRDRLSTPLGGGGVADIVFWCPKCGTAKTQRLVFPYRDGTMPRQRR